MTQEEKLHKLIHANLCLLQENGHKIECNEGMFVKHNIVGFETVGYALLMIINPVECKKLIPWPLLDTKSLRNEFRTKFSEFIKITKSKHPESGLTEIRASELQFPGGIKFLRFMHKLSTFTVELELRRLTGREEEDNLIQRPMFTKKLKDNETKLKIIQEGRHILQADLWNYKDHQEKALPLLRELEERDKNMQRKLNQTREKLTPEVSSLEFQDEVKDSLMDFENLNDLQAWNLKVETIRQDLEGRCRKLSNIRDLSAQTCQLLRTIQTQKAVSTTEALCLDGTQLKISHIASSLVGVCLYNSRGQIKLEPLLKCGQSSAEELLSKSSPGSSLLSQAQAVLETLQAQRNRAAELSSALDSVIQSNRETIKRLRPIVYDRFRDSQYPDYFEDFKQNPTVHFNTPISKCSSSVSPFKRGNKSRWALIAKSSLKHKTRNTVVVSVKQRRRSGGHSIFTTPAPRQQQFTCLPFGDKQAPQSTRIPRVGISNTTNQQNLGTLYKQGNARKSLFRKLPVGKKDPVSIGTTSTPADNQMKAKVPSFNISSSDYSYASEPSQPSTFGVESSFMKPTPRTKRKSIDLIVEKYRKFREKMEPSIVLSSHK